MDEPDTMRLDLPASYKYLDVLGGCIATLLQRIDTLAEPAATIYNVQLAVHEACVNIVEHAYAGQPADRIQVLFTINDHTPPCYLAVELHDTGQSFDMESVPAPDLDDVHEGGYGLFLLHSLMDEVTYLPQPGNNRWRLVKYLPQETEALPPAATS